jgi:predicted  nucleic acid-binding Zn-ribbon protein
MKDTKSLLLVLLSFGLVATWIYHFYDKSNNSGRLPESYTRSDTSTANSAKSRDSLQRTYTAILNNMDLRLDSSRSTSDSLREELENKINEVNRLKAEITNILKSPKTTSTELIVARQKMKEMEEIIRQLREENTAMELEKRQLSARLDQMSGEAENLQKNIRRLDDENKGLKENVKNASVFVASALHFTTLHTRSDKEQETSQAKRANKFVASFILQNNLNEYPNAEVMIVINQPDGRVLQNSAWDSGTFDTKSEGRKNFTRKMRFDYTKGEQKALIFTLDFDTFRKGTYILQIWHNGIKIGETSKTLS